MMGRAVQALTRQRSGRLVIVGSDHFELRSGVTFVVDEEEIGFQEVSDAN
jgi:hypothetical protein